jgi:hypothetical protein
VALLLLQDQHSKLFQMLQNGSQQSWMNALLVVMLTA